MAKSTKCTICIWFYYYPFPYFFHILTFCAAPRAQKSAGISSQNSKVTKKSPAKAKPVASKPVKKAAAATVPSKKEAAPAAEKIEDDDFEKFASTDDEDLSSLDEAEVDTFLEGFESTDDEEGNDDKEEEEAADFDSETGLSKDPKTATEQTEKLENAKARAAAATANGSNSTSSRKSSNGKDDVGKVEGRGVLYVGRIPHGFYEEQMKGYFSQFGTITRLRLSRNKKTGKSKHYAFIEFESTAVAKVVADTMDNYLMFGHILKVKLLTEDQVRDDLFIGANKTFKAIAWNEVNHQKINEPKTREFWEGIQLKDKEHREKRQERLKSLGINYDYSTPAPALAIPEKVTAAAPAPKTKAAAATPAKTRAATAVSAKTTSSPAAKVTKPKSKKKKAAKKA